MAEKVLWLAIGALVTIVTGWYCECFLKCSVKAKPKTFNLAKSQEGGGGKQLGVLERLLFYASLWSAQYSLAGGWLVFKAAGKWAAWQHIARLPSTDATEDVEDRIVASSRLLGRFFNGTLYNGLCALCGLGAQRLSRHVWENSLFSVTTDSVVWLSVAITTGVIVLLGVGLFFNWPSFCEGKAESDDADRKKGTG